MQSEYKDFFKNARSAGQVRKDPPPVRKKKVALSPQSEMAANLRSRRRRHDYKRRKYWFLATLSFLGATVCGYALYDLDNVESFLSQTEFKFNFKQSAGAEEKPAASADSTAQQETTKTAEKPGATKDGDKTETAAKEKAGESVQVTSEVKMTKQHLTSFLKRQRELDAREDELNRLEAELRLQKEEIDKKLLEINNVRSNIAATLEDRIKVDAEKVDTLVQVYSTMKPVQAAAVIEEMEEDLAIEILSKMKKKNAADIMNLVKPAKLKVFSEKFAGFKTQ